MRHTPRRSSRIGADDIDPGVGVVDPVDRHLVDPQPHPLGDHQQLGVEEPLVVLDEGSNRVGDVTPEGLEPALGVAEAAPQGQVEQRVVASGR